MTYQRSSPPLVPPFLAGAQSLAQQLHDTLPLSVEDKAFLQDVRRGRYAFVAEQRLMAIAALSPDPALREAMPELARAECLRGIVVSTSLTPAFDEETRAVADAELPQREFERAPCTSTYQRVRDALRRQLAATRRSLDAVNAFHL